MKVTAITAIGVYVAPESPGQNLRAVGLGGPEQQREGVSARLGESLLARLQQSPENEAPVEDTGEKVAEAVRAANEAMEASGKSFVVEMLGNEPPYCITKLTDHDGTVLYQFPAEHLDKTFARLMDPRGTLISREG